MHERGDLVAVVLVGERKISARVESGIVNKCSTWPEDSTTRWCGGISMRTGLFTQDDSMIVSNTALVVGGHAVRATTAIVGLNPRLSRSSTVC